jgi:hypothetical protein
MAEAGKPTGKSFALTTYTDYADIHIVLSVVCVW